MSKQEWQRCTVLHLFLKVSHITPGSVTDNDGRLQVNDWVLSINGKSTIGANSSELNGLLELSRDKSVFIISRSRSPVQTVDMEESLPIQRESSSLSRSPSLYRKTEVKDCTREKSNILVL